MINNSFSCQLRWREQVVCFSKDERWVDLIYYAPILGIIISHPVRYKINTHSTESNTMLLLPIPADAIQTYNYTISNPRALFHLYNIQDLI
jgi:hypothetical protein